MDQDILSEPVKGKVYKSNTIKLAAVFGGPLAGGYMIATNFKVFGDTQKMKAAWLITIVITFALTSISLLPFFNQVPGIVYSIAYYSIAGYFVQKFQSFYINQHIENGGLEHSKGNAFAIVLLGIITIVIAVILIYYLRDSFITAHG